MSGLRLDALESGTWKRRVSLDLETGHVAVLLGRNRAGKTTFLNTLAGLWPARSGSIVWQGQDLTSGDERQRIRAGIRIAPEGRQLFGPTLRPAQPLGAYDERRSGQTEADLMWIMDTFPELATLLERPAGALSGGEQTMVSIGRTLMGRPSLLLLDEPTLGLSPSSTLRLIEALKHGPLRRDATAIIAEQTGAFALHFPERLWFMRGGEIVFQGSLTSAEDNGALSEVFA